MRLTYATLGALLKYPWTSHFAEAKPKFSCFQTEYDALCEIAAELGLIEKIHDRSELKAEYARHPLAYLVEAADDIDKKEKLADRIYRNDRNVPLELGVYSVLRTPLETSVGAAREIVNGGRPSYRTKIIRKFMKQDTEDCFKGKDLYGVIMLFLDYVTGMTDDYATYVNRQLLGIGN